MIDYFGAAPLYGNSGELLAEDAKITAVLKDGQTVPTTVAGIKALPQGPFDNYPVGYTVP